MTNVIRFHCEESHKSECDGDISEWRIDGYDPVPAFILCDKHAAEFGFCTWCGAFIGGTEDVFLTGRKGICFDCFMRMEHDMQRSFDDGDDGEDDYEN